MNKFIFLMLLPVVLGRRMSIGKRLTMGSSESYTFHSTPATFDEAKSICKQEGGSLAVVTSQEAEDEMLRIWRRSGPILNPTNGLKLQAYIGIHSLNKEGHWETIDGESPRYINWSQDWAGGRQPSTPSVQKCGSLLKQGGMDDVECYFKLAFFCTSV
ncbi:lectin [Cotesia vestalis bracovirus]|nr:lectin [Cotesia vestalis bracovirus]USH59363.1 C-type lectin [Cotesia vestalis bracovirus]